MRFIIFIIFFVSAIAVLRISLNRIMNPVVSHGPYYISQESKKIHEQLFVADMHSDQLLWNKNLLEESKYGHLDLVRAKNGNLGLEVYSSVTKVPFGQNYGSNSDGIDKITALTIVQFWPFKTWFSLMERSLYMAFKLHQFERDSLGQLFILKTKSDLRRLMEKRELGPYIHGALLSIEGGQVLEGKLENIDKLYEAGYRMFGLSHFIDTDIGGSAHGVNKKGLTDFGNSVINRLSELGMIIDLAHSSKALMIDVLETTKRPVVISHTGVLGTCEGPRNISDDILYHIKNVGGVIGIGFWKEAVCGEDVESIVRAIRYVVDKIGIDYVALGSDFEGTVKTPFDVSGLGLLTDSLLKAGFSILDIQKIMGRNILRVLLNSLKD